jgi:hypothetical protein
MENVDRNASTGAVAGSAAPLRAPLFDTRHLQNLAQRGFAGGAEFEDAVRELELRASEERRAQEAAEVARAAQRRRFSVVRRALAVVALIACIVLLYLLIP